MTQLSELQDVVDRLQYAKTRAANDLLEKEVQHLTQELERYKRKLKAEKALVKRLKHHLDVVSPVTHINNTNQLKGTMMSDKTTSTNMSVTQTSEEAIRALTISNQVEHSHDREAIARLTAVVEHIANMLDLLAEPERERQVEEFAAHYGNNTGKDNNNE